MVAGIRGTCRGRGGGRPGINKKHKQKENPLQAYQNQKKRPS